MFFGRGEEISKILSNTYEGCLVFGGRQLGKSALLHHVKFNANRPEMGRIAVLQEVKTLGLPEEPAGTIWRYLHKLLSNYNGVVRKESIGDRDATMSDIQRWLKEDTRRRILALFDETDEFISAESTSGFPEITRLKDLMEKTERQFKVVFAGLHNVQRLYKALNSPLPHFQEPMVVGPLNRTHEDKRAARDLVIKPMRAAGFCFEEQAAVDKILSYTNEYPSLLQEFLKGLLDQVNRMIGNGRGRLDTSGPLWTIPTNIILHHDNSDEIARKIRDKFHLTLDLDVRYSLIAYLMAQLAHGGRKRAVLNDGLRPRELHGEALLYWPESVDYLDVERFGVILDEMYDLGVLGCVKAADSNINRYCLRSPAVLRMLGKDEDVEEKLLQIPEYEPNVRYDSALHRRSADGKGGKLRVRQYLPLTDHQVDCLFDWEAKGTRVVCGLKALGLDQFGAILSSVNHPKLLGIDADMTVEIFDAKNAKLSDLVNKKVPRNTVHVVVHLQQSKGKEGKHNKDAVNTLTLLDKHPQVMQGKVYPVLLLDATCSELRNIAIRRSDKTTQFIAPWSDYMLRKHLRQVEANHLDLLEIRRAILDATGGIPDRIETLVHDIWGKDDPIAAINSSPSSSRKFAGSTIETMLAKALSPQLCRALELIIDQKLDASQRPQDYDALDQLLHGEVKDDLVTLAPDLFAMGLLRAWSPSNKTVKTSALGRLVLKALNKEDDSAEGDGDGRQHPT